MSAPTTCLAVCSAADFAHPSSAPPTPPHQGSLQRPRALSSCPATPWLLLCPSGPQGHLTGESQLGRFQCPAPSPSLSVNSPPPPIPLPPPPVLAADQVVHHHQLFPPPLTLLPSREVCPPSLSCLLWPQTSPPQPQLSLLTATLLPTFQGFTVTSRCLWLFAVTQKQCPHIDKW